MINAVLFDLDGTLLDLTVGLFMPRYLESLGAHLAHRIDPAQMAAALKAGTQAMLDNTDPEITLQQAFDGVFYPRIGLRREDLLSDLDRFYREQYPLLKELARPVAEAPRLVELVFQRRWKVAVATNPLFPLTAAEQRLGWAGLNSGRVPFDLVTSYETMHFAKPRPEYVAESLARIAATPEESLFVGDDPRDDIAPAKTIGLASYQVYRDGDPPSPSVRGGGSLQKLAAGLAAEDDDPSLFLPSAASPCSLPALMTGNLAAMLHLFESSGWVCCPAEEGWAPVEIACHLRDVEREVMQPRLRSILSAENPYLPAIESDRWAEERKYGQQDGRQALKDFVAARKETTALLCGLREADWRRAARHALFGPTTLEEQARFVARHDLLHVEQLQGAVAACGH
jgi:FMN phosphatase YigB (HAD superfamily)